MPAQVDRTARAEVALLLQPHTKSQASRLLAGRKRFRGCGLFTALQRMGLSLYLAARSEASAGDGICHPQSATGGKQACSYDVELATCRLFVTEKIPGTVFARIPTVFLSVSLSTTPSNVTRPFLTMMRIGLITGRSYLRNAGNP